MAPRRKPAKPKLAIDTRDLWGSPVQCTQAWWVSHVLDPIEGHPELTGREADVARAIQDPDIVRPSTKTGKAFAFETVSTTETIRAIVYYDDPKMLTTGRTSGQMATAYPDDPAYTSQVGSPIYRKAKPKTGGK
jgi:hypothetical protein